jgi:fibronectin type 3 domain-containing protein
MAHGILLKWDPPPDANATTVYNVYRGTTKGGEVMTSPINSSPITGTSYDDPIVAIGQAEFYVVEAITNGTSSGPSIEVTATELPYAPPNVTAAQH